MRLNWKGITDRAKRSHTALRLADRLGRSRGRLRAMDGMTGLRPAPVKPDLSGWHDHELATAWLGHATLLLRVGGMTILTDPVFSSRIGIGLGLLTGGPKRLVAPALSIGELPPLDLILISHAHFDHLDRPSLHRLPKSTPIIAAHDTSDLIRDIGFSNITELRWGETRRMGPLNITARPVAHWGARAFYDSHRGYAAFLLETDRRRVLYGADTAFCDFFRDLGGVDLAILGIGGYNPYVQAHATPEQAWAMANDAKAQFVLPMHHSTFRLSYEPVAEPMHRLLDAANGEHQRVIVRRVGEQWAM
jgi:L-ascorbate metabolism protein UlaG (beta-lactamase superfamily)